MPAFDRFDPFELRIADAIDEIAAARLPDYLDDIFQTTGRTSQRPRWTFLERWLPVDTTLSPRPIVGRVPILGLVLLLLLALVAGTLLVFVGSQPRVPAPFGPAANGTIAYPANGDIYVRDAMSGEPRLLIGGTGEQVAPDYSPDGTMLAFVTSLSDGDHFAVARADGTSIRELALVPASGNAQSQWSPDSSRLGLIYDVKGIPQLSIAPVNGGAAQVIDLGGFRPLDLAWQPPAGKRLLVRAQAAQGEQVSLFTMNPDGSDRRVLVPAHDSPYGHSYTLSGATWWPDASRIIYNSIDPIPGRSDVTHFRIHVVNADGTNDIEVPSPADPLVQQAWPHLSPDGRSILVNQWTWTGDDKNAKGWLALMSSDLSGPAHRIGPTFDGGENTGLPAFWSPDGSRILVRVDNAHEIWSVDPVSGVGEHLSWAGDLPGWQRRAP
jgi:Tol biopolymer transport system component